MQKKPSVTDAGWVLLWSNLPKKRPEKNVDAHAIFILFMSSLFFVVYIYASCDKKQATMHWGERNATDRVSAERKRC